MNKTANTIAANQIINHKITSSNHLNFFQKTNNTTKYSENAVVMQIKYHHGTSVLKRRGEIKGPLCFCSIVKK